MGFKDDMRKLREDTKADFKRSNEEFRQKRARTKRKGYESA